jgi:hypothetical protein
VRVLEVGHARLVGHEVVDDEDVAGLLACPRCGRAEGPDGDHSEQGGCKTGEPAPAVHPFHLASLRVVSPENGIRGPGAAGFRE